VEVDSTPECIRPESQVDGGRPALARMQELLPRTLPEVSDGFLCNAILEVGIDPTEGESLSFCTAAVLEGVVCKSSVVALVVEDADVMLLGEVFEGLLGFHGFLGGKLGHQMNVLEPRVVVHKDGGCHVALVGECPFQLSNESHLR
jgi:hypothetical protein